MYLKRLEIQGFKSFADKTSIDFENGITGVVGPNGSGKSNISDAIRWVLGEQSAKTLRGSKMEDVIFSGTSKRRPLGFGEVTLVLDNKNKEIPIDFSEVSVTRRVFRSGESEYYINKTSSRLKDVRELFMDTGVGTDGYSIIGQGKIEEILSTKSDDRRNLIEEAVGIVKYKTRKKESERKLEKTKDNLIRINDIADELFKQIDPLKSQSEKASEYIDLTKDLKDLEVNLFIREIVRLKEQIEHLNHQKDLVEKQYTFNNKKKNEIEEKFQEVKNLIENMDKSIEKIQEKKQCIQSENEKKEGDYKLRNEQISFLNKEIKRLNSDLEHSMKTFEEKNEELETLLKEKDKISLSMNKFQSILDDKIDELKSQEDVVNLAEENIEKKKSSIIDFLNNITEKKGKINTIESFYKNIDKRLEQIIEEKTQLIDRKESLNSQISCITEEMEELKIQLDNSNKEKISLISKIESSRKNIEITSDNINDLKGDIQSRNSKLNMLENMKDHYEGYYKGVKNILLACKKNESLQRGVKGVVAELIKVDEKFDKSIEIALGAAAQNIVTNTREDAKKLIDYLKENKLGRVTFLPMDAIKGRNLNDYESQILNNQGVLGVASSIVKFDAKFKDIFEYLLGRVVIVKDLSTGITISKKINSSFKIVTLDGDVLNPGGSMTGGNYKNTNNSSLIGRDREIGSLKKEIDNKVEKYNGLVKDYSSLKEEISTLENSLEELNDQISSFKININSTSNKISTLEEQFIEIEKRINKFTKEIQSLENEKSESVVQIDNIKEEIKELEEKNNLTKGNIEIDLKDFEDKKQETKDLNEEITKVKVELASTEQKKNEIINISSRLEEEIKNLLHKRKDIEKEISEKEINIEKTKDIIAKISEEKEELEDKLSQCNSDLVEIKNKKTLYLDTFYKEQEELKRMNKNITELQKSINTMEIKLAKYETQLENYNNKLWEEYELTYQMALEFRREIENVTKVQNNVREIKRRIKDLGNVNIDSIEQYKEVSERYEFLSNQREDLINAKKSLVKVIDDMETKMIEQFVENFEIIKDNFKEIFSKLFGGGKADIFLSDEENVLTSPIEIIAQPPGKKLQNISLLSGGEKALTAISLLFAILKLKPTPFCVLDEIEAALDDANVVRFAEYLRYFSDKTQFIIITHRKGTMESVDSLYGVTMEENGVSKLLSVKLSDLIEEIAS
ncbi:chromosome segregation protein SMC [Clostridium sp. D2Q-11]|uniref:Chromosome partition protein Smc n=1 Tax=Anaeromonas frigoriresistens TaxID=2683708 RepID=A0A942Z9X3_9FIRM|nr:chromosome segregation protein SMC [Anaeromonas frigoriresistens]MBS4539768.1 chromosome segregation protein SMC [Anaeromonas frigoriresistens]